MDLGVLTRIAGLLGGLCWVVWAVTDERGAPAGVVDALYWGGLALIGLAMVGYGALLVSSSAVWLRVVVGLCLPLLAWSVLSVLRSEFADPWVGGIFGLLLALESSVGLVRRRPRHHGGAHAK